MSKLRLLSLFSGIGSFERALTNLGVEHEIVGFSEIDKWAIQSYCAVHDVGEELNLGDVSKIRGQDLPNADLITYGFPCQDISVAGKGKGISEDTRSGLLYEAERIIEHVKPKYAIAENVKNLVGKRFKEDFEELLERLEGYGYNNYWEVLNAKDYGIPQNRERVFIVSIRKDIDDGGFEFPTGFDSSLKLKGLLLDEVEDKYYINTNITRELITKVSQGSNNMSLGNINPSGKGMNGNVYNVNRESPTLTTNKGEGIKIVEPTIIASRGRYSDGSGSGSNSDMIEQKLEPNLQGTTNTIPTVQKDNWLLEPKVAVREATKKGYDVATVGDTINVAFPNSKTRRGRVQKDLAGTLETQCNQATLEHDYRIRKLTPQECWRLMGFEDEDYWIARRRLEEVFYNGGDRSNSQMYKQAGNAIVVDVIEAIFRELLI